MTAGGYNGSAMEAMMTATETRKLDPKDLEKAAPQLYSSLKTIMGWLTEGKLVRDISRDHEDGWAIRMVGFVAELGKAQQALLTAEGPEWCYTCDRPKGDCACVENGGTY